VKKKEKEPILPPHPRTGMIMMITPYSLLPTQMDIPSVRRPPVPVMVPADQVSTPDLPLTDTLAVVERELFHNLVLLVR